MTPIQRLAPTHGPTLGIETSCDETAVAIVCDGVVLSNRVASQVPIHKRFGGVVPEVAARNHLLTILPTIELALADTGLQPSDLAGIAVTNRPGLIGALLVGVQTAKALAFAWQLPIVGVDHIEAHVWACQLRPPGVAGSDWPRPQCPFLALAVSGGHTSLYRIDAANQSERLGATLDDAAGEAFDKFARLVGLPYPGGPLVDRAAASGDAKAFSFPRGMLGRSDLAMSFSGLKTSARLQIEALQAQGCQMTESLQGDLCASFQASVVEQLTRVTIKAALRHHLRDVVIAGGVAANRHLRAAMADQCTENNLQFWPVPLAYCTDNGAMIAGLGEALLRRGVRDDAFTLDAIATGAVRAAHKLVV